MLKGDSARGKKLDGGGRRVWIEQTRGCPRMGQRPIAPAGAFGIRKVGEVKGDCVRAGVGGG